MKALLKLAIGILSISLLIPNATFAKAIENQGNVGAPTSEVTSGGGGTLLICGILGKCNPPSNPQSTPSVLGDSTTNTTALTACENYITDKLSFGAKNNPEQVKRLQEVLNQDGFKLEITGIFDTTTLNAVKKFQTKYSSSILAPWGLTQPTGIVFVTTRKRLNEIHCGQLTPSPLTPEEQSQINSSK